MLKIYNSLSRKKEEFKPIELPHVGMYTCGMTVYDYAHIGHGRKYVIDDVLRRTLSSLGYKVKHVQNVTDVGHLVSDSDEGDDKLEKGAEKAGKTVWETAKFFTEHFYSSMDKLNILRPDVIARATDHIPEQIELIKKLVEKGFAYDTSEAVYFNVSKFPSYGEMFGQKLEDKKTAVREEVQTGEHKKNPQDFALWFKRVGRFANHAMHWDSPWGDGFPGWHIECSAMSMKYLGEQFDIHTGGEDHRPIHHPNEIAQSEAATGKQPFVKYWLHTAFLNVEGKKMSKSLGNYYTVEDVVEKGHDPIALRYLYLTAHYRDPLNFTWESLEAAQTALKRLRSVTLTPSEAKWKGSPRDSSPKAQNDAGSHKEKFLNALNDDLNTAQALAVVWDTLKSDLPQGDKRARLLYFDEVLGLGLSEAGIKEEKIDTETGAVIINRTGAPLSNATISQLDYRNTVKTQGDFGTADQIRIEIKARDNVVVRDTNVGTVVEPNK